MIVLIVIAAFVVITLTTNSWLVYSIPLLIALFTGMYALLAVYPIGLAVLMLARQQ